MNVNVDRRLLRPLAFVLLAGAVMIWSGIAIKADSVQLIGVAVCVVAFVRLAVAGWRISHGR